MNPLKSRYYPAVMFVLLISVLLMIFFNFVNMFDTLDKSVTNNIDKNPILTGNVISNNITSSANNAGENTTETTEENIPTLTSYTIFYIILIAIILTIIIVAFSLKTTVMKNIELEEKRKRL